MSNNTNNFLENIFDKQIKETSAILEQGIEQGIDQGRFETTCGNRFTESPCILCCEVNFDTQIEQCKNWCIIKHNIE